MQSEKTQRSTTPESWTDRELLQRLRRDDTVAVREFYRRFTPVLWQIARQAHVQPALVDDVVTDSLTDSVLHLMQPTVAEPANLPAYLVTALRHRLANERRAAERRNATSSAASWSGDGEPVVREVCSEASIRASAGPAAESAPLSPMLARLSRVINATLSDDERQMLRWVGASIPQRVIAEWLGITHNAARVRVLRLRDRLFDIALRGDAAWTPHERQELYEFFRRSGLGERASRALRDPGATDPGPIPRRRPGRRKPTEEDL